MAQDESTTSKDQDGKQLPPALYTHCLKLWNRMKEESSPGHDGMLVWRGHMTSFLEQELGFKTNYTRIVSALTDMDCVRMLRRGSIGTPGIWLIVQEPTLDLWEAAGYRRYRGRPRRKMDDVAFTDLRRTVMELVRKVSDLSVRVDALEVSVGTGDDEEEM